MNTQVSPVFPHKICCIAAMMIYNGVTSSFFKGNDHDQDHESTEC